MAKEMIRPLHSEADYDAALKQIERYFESEPKLGTMRMAWRLHREWGIPAEALIAPPRTRGRRSAA
jgi:HTH-type transcriptional regulator / antitoxin HigA